MFDVNYTTFNFTNIRKYTYNSTLGKIKRIAFTNPSIFLALMEQNKLLVFQIFPQIIKEVQEHISMNPQRIIIDFDFIDDTYIVLYHNDSIT